MGDILFELEFEAQDMQNREGPSVEAKLEQEEADDDHRDKDLPNVDDPDADRGDDLGEPGKARHQP